MVDNPQSLPARNCEATRVTRQRRDKIAQLAGGEQQAAQSNLSIDDMPAAEV
jgi:hypothetical protein